MNNASIVGEFQFGTGKIYADHTGKFSLHFWNNTLWTFDVGEITRNTDTKRRITVSSWNDTPWKCC